MKTLLSAASLMIACALCSTNVVFADETDRAADAVENADEPTVDSGLVPEPSLSLASLEPSSAPSDLIDLEVMAGDVHGYYEGELISTYIVTGLGLGAIGAGIPLALQNDDFARGLGWPLLILGALQSVGAVLYALQVGEQRAHYGAALERDPAGFRDEESEHMAGTIDRFVFYQITEVVLTLGGAGIAAYGFAAEDPLFQGIGIGVAALALPFLIIDLINQQRGARYADNVRRVDTSASASLPQRPSWGDSMDRLAGSAAVSDGFYLSVTRQF